MPSKEISAESTLSLTNVNAVMYVLGQKLQFYLQEGKTVELENIGKFKLGFKCKAEEDAFKANTKAKYSKISFKFSTISIYKAFVEKRVYNIQRR